MRCLGRTCQRPQTVSVRNDRRTPSDPIGSDDGEPNDAWTDRCTSARRMKRSHAIALAGIVIVAAIVWLSRHHDTATAASATRAAPKPPNSAPLMPRGEAGDDVSFVADADRVGSLLLEGEVIDEHERPVANAEVTINTNPTRTVRTEQDGAFHVDSLVGRAYTLVARSDLGFAGPIIARLTSKSEPVILKLRPAAAIEVHVTSHDDRPIAGAVVEARTLAAVTATTDHDGNARLTGLGPGPCTLAASANGYAKTFQEVRVPSAATDVAVVARVQLRLRQGASATGRVVSPDGVPVAGARVRFSSLSDFTSRADPLRDAAVTDATGRFRFDAIAAGTYRFLATHERHAPGSSSPMKLDGANPREGIEIRLQPAATIADDVVSKHGDPVSLVTLRITARASGSSYEAPRQAYSDEHGHFEITGLPRQRLQLVALHESGASRVIDVDMTGLESKRDLKIALDVDGAISGTVVDTTGEPVAGATVWANRKVGTGDMRFLNQLRGFSQEITDGGGHFRIGGLSPGDYLVYASHGVGAKKGDMRLRQGTPAKIGDSAVTITLDEDGGFQGTVVLADGTHPPMFAVHVGRGDVVPFMTTDGRFVVTGLPTGPTSMHVDAPMFDPSGADVTIRPSKIVDIGTITLHRGRSISGRVLTSDNQPVPNANVYAGAHVFGDGQQAGSIDVNLPGARGTPMSQTTSDEDGSYTLSGIGVGDLTLMAESDAGRSSMQTVPGSPESSTLDLVLQPFSAIEGTVTQGAQPLGNIPITATAQSASTSSFVVSSGPDGTFRFDRLAPDTYKVSAVVGRSPKQGLQYTGATVTAIGGQTATVQLNVDSGVTLLVNVTSGGATLDRAIVYVLAGVLAPPNAKVLAQAAGTTAGYTFTGAALSGAPATVQSIPLGHYTACAVAMPNEVDGMAESFAYIDRIGDQLPAVCTQVDIAAAPAQQSTSLVVSVPTYVPPPDGTQDPGGTGSGAGSGSKGSGA